MIHDDNYWMRLALEAAADAQAIGEVPVGCVILQHEKLIARGSNRTITEKDPTAHAEIVALRIACKDINNYRLPGAIVYTTLEPCVMCIGALLHARISRLVFGAYDSKFGAVGSVTNVLQHKWNHTIEYKSEVLMQESIELLKKFFADKR